MKSVLISNRNMSRKYSGATRTIYEQIRFFYEMGYKVYVIADEINKKDVDETKNKNIIFIKTFYWPWEKRLKRSFRYSKNVSKIIEQIKPDITISHGDYPDADYFFTHNDVCLAHERMYGSKLSNANIMHQIQVPIFEGKTFKKIIANSELVKNDVCERFDIDQNIIDVIYPSIYQQDFLEPSQTQIDTLKDSFHIDKNLLLVGLVTSGDFKKRNLKQYFEAINLLPQDLAEKCYFIFIGKDRVYPEAKAALEINKYKERIEHIPLIKEVSVLFHALDLFVLPAKFEEFGRVVAEAMTCGTPVITNKWVGASELLEGASKDFIYDGESTSILAEMMETVLLDKDLRSELSRQNKVSAQRITEDKTYESLKVLLT